MNTPARDNAVRCPPRHRQAIVDGWRRQAPTATQLLAAFTIAAGMPAVNAAGAPASTSPPDDGPFSVLGWRDGVTTSRNGDAVWTSTTATGHTAQIPGYARPAGPPGHHIAFGVSCRAAGDDLAADFQTRLATGEIHLGNHPEHPGVYLVWHPMHWLLELIGRSVETWPGHDADRGSACDGSNAAAPPDRLLGAAPMTHDHGAKRSGADGHADGAAGHRDGQPSRTSRCRSSSRYPSTPAGLRRSLRRHVCKKPPKAGYRSAPDDRSRSCRPHGRYFGTCR